MAPESLTLLFVESDPQEQQTWTTILKSDPSLVFEVQMAGTLQDALAALDQNTFDLILLNLKLPDSEGLETLRRMESRLHTQTVVVLTPPTLAKWGMEAIQMGAQDYIVQNQLDAPHVIKTLWQAIQRKQTAQALRRTHELEAALAQERKMRTLQERFMAMVEDQFRTPLTIISTAAALLEMRADRMTEEQRLNHLKQIQGASLNMNNVLDNILSVSLAQNNELAFSPTQLNLHLFCHDIVKHFRHKQGAKHEIELVVKEADFTGNFDGSLVGEIVTNLLSNAVKFSPPYTQVTVELQMKNQQATIKVTDQGVGISEADRPFIFDLFFQGQNGYFSPGIGIGLTIVKQAVQLHQGTIHVQTQEGGGTTFIVQLPANLT